MFFSVIIPTFNEENIILQQIREVKSFIDTEIVIVDGGSTDSTKEICEKEQVIVVSSPRGRGTQCRIGAQAASNDCLLFIITHITFYFYIKSLVRLVKKGGVLDE